MIHENLGLHLPAAFIVRSANGRAIHVSDSFHTANPSRNDETRRVDGSIHI